MEYMMVYDKKQAVYHDTYIKIYDRTLQWQVSQTSVNFMKDFDSIERDQLNIQAMLKKLGL